MAFLNWDEGLCSGVDSIDEEHKQIFILLDNLYQLAQAGADDVAFMSAFYELEQHYKAHFRNEEKLIRQYLPDRYAEHCKEHQNFCDELDLLKPELASSNSVEFIEDALMFVRDWVIDHILEYDIPLSLKIHELNQQRKRFSYNGLVRKMAEMLSLPMRIVLTASIPIICIVSFASYQIFQDYQELERTRKVQSMITAVGYSGELIHLLQLERDLSMAMVNANYNKYKQQLLMSHQKTDESLSRLMSRVFEHQDPLDFPSSESLFPRLATLSANVELVKEQRKLLEHQKTNVTLLQQSYTQLIENLLAFSDRMVHVDTTNELYNQVNAKIALLHYKETISLGRALGEIAIHNGNRQKGFTSYTGALGEVNGHLDLFYRTASQKQQSLWQQHIHSEQAKNAYTISEQLEYLWRMDTIADMDEQLWWQTQTEYLNSLYDLLQAMEADFSINLDDYVDQLHHQIVFAVSLSLISFLLLFAACHLLATSITYQINRVTKSLTQLSKGRYTCLLAEGRHDDAFQKISHAYELCRMQQLRSKFQHEQLAMTDKQVKRYKAISSTDFLTGINNRRKFDELMQAEFQRANRYQRELCLLTLDIDHFKKVNDSYGHKVGDLAIKHIVDSCLGHIRDSDIIGRLGGEEFGLLLPETTAVQGFELAQRIRKAIAESALLADGNDIRLTISIGIAMLDLANPNSAMEDLANQSDLALYQAKNTGRNKVCIYDQDNSA